MGFFSGKIRQQSPLEIIHHWEANDGITNGLWRDRVRNVSGVKPVDFTPFNTSIAGVTGGKGVYFRGSNQSNLRLGRVFELHCFVNEIESNTSPLSYANMIVDFASLGNTSNRPSFTLTCKDNTIGFNTKTFELVTNQLVYTSVGIRTPNLYGLDIKCGTYEVGQGYCRMFLRVNGEYVESRDLLYKPITGVESSSTSGFSLLPSIYVGAGYSEGFFVYPQKLSIKNVKIFRQYELQQ